MREIYNSYSKYDWYKRYSKNMDPSSPMEYVSPMFPSIKVYQIHVREMCHGINNSVGKNILGLFNSENIWERFRIVNEVYNEEYGLYFIISNKDYYTKENLMYMPDILETLNDYTEEPIFI